VDAVMTAHMAVPALDPSEMPATVSSRIMTGLLREDLGFKGLVVTDAMNMNGLTKQVGAGEAAVRSIEAGVDVLLMPPDPELVIKAILKAIDSKRLTAKRIDQSVLKILDAKVKLGLYKKRTVDPEAVSDVLDDEDELAQAQKVADHGVTLIRNQSELVPLASPQKSCLVISVGIRMSSFGQRFLEEYRRRAPQARTILLDNSLPAAALDSSVGDLSTCSAIVFASYTTNPNLAGDLPTLLDRLTAGPVPVVFVTFGNPYLLAKYPKVAAYMAAFSTTPTSETAAAKALFGEIPITGRMPVSIPGLAQYGDGLQVQAAVESKAAPKPAIK
jgi:beta-N-acetylhexosaminidase